MTATKLKKESKETLLLYNNQSPNATSRIEEFLNTVTREIEQCSKILVPVKTMTDSKRVTGSQWISSWSLISLNLTTPSAFKNNKRNIVKKHCNKKHMAYLGDQKKAIKPEIEIGKQILVQHGSWNGREAIQNNGHDRLEFSRRLFLWPLRLLLSPCGGSVWSVLLHVKKESPQNYVYNLALNGQ